MILGSITEREEIESGLTYKSRKTVTKKKKKEEEMKTKMIATNKTE